MYRRIVNHTGFEYQVKPVLELTRDEVLTLCGLSNGHYDLKCRSFSQPGGLLRGFANLFENGFDEGTGIIKVSVSTKDLNVICKIVEMDHNPSRWDGLQDAFSAADKEWKRLNETKLHPDMEEAIRLLHRADQCPTPGNCTCQSEIADFVRRMREKASSVG